MVKLWFFGLIVICYVHPKKISKNGEDFAIWSYFWLAYSRYLPFTWMSVLSVRSFVVAPGVLPTSGFVGETMAAKVSSNVGMKCFFLRSHIISQWSIWFHMISYGQWWWWWWWWWWWLNGILCWWFDLNPSSTLALSPIDVLIFALLAWNPGPINCSNPKKYCMCFGLILIDVLFCKLFNVY